MELVEHDLVALSAQEQEEYLRKQMLLDRVRPFSIGIPDQPLFRCQWFWLAETRFELLISIHHAIDDGWGNQQFLRQLFDAYRAAKRGDDVYVPERANVHKEFVALEQALEASPATQAFWGAQTIVTCGKSLLGSANELAPVSDSGRTILVPCELYEELCVAARRRKISLKALFLSAYLDLISDEVAGEALTVGVVSNGRSERLSDPLGALGLFWTFVPFCMTHWTSSDAARSARVQSLLAQIESHAAYPLNRIVPGIAADEIFFATFNFVDFRSGVPLDARDGIALMGRGGLDRFHFPLNYLFSVDRIRRTVVVHVEFDSRYVSAARVDSMNNKLLTVLRTHTPGCAAA